MKSLPIIISAIVNLIVPGTGFAFNNKFKLAFVTQLSLFIPVLILSWSRLILYPTSIGIIATNAVFIYILSTATCLLKAPNTIPLTLNRIMKTTFFMVAGVAIFTVAFIYKQHLLGVNIYFIPSMSMHPTLSPGQFVLTDSWAYRKQEPQPDDIVVFKLSDNSPHFVKRVSQWPNGDSKQNDQFFVLGDNRDHSTDSRIFGSVDRSRISDKVVMILFGINQEKQIIGTHILQSVN